jgi:hypothetical protein
VTTETKIIVRPEVFGVGYDVIVHLSPVGGSLNQERPDHTSAMQYAAQLRNAHGWQVHDETGGDA